MALLYIIILSNETINRSELQFLVPIYEQNLEKKVLNKKNVKKIKLFYFSSINLFNLI